jgi:hypothetical protein
MDLDLHGVRHYDVDRVVENFVYINQGSVPLTVICGNSTKMLLLAKETINRIGCEYNEPRFGTICIIRIN